MWSYVCLALPDLSTLQAVFGNYLNHFQNKFIACLESLSVGCTEASAVVFMNEPRELLQDRRGWVVIAAAIF